MKGIVFEGGGAKGAYQIGAAKALDEMGFEFDAVAGTSVGALNGAAVAQGDVTRAYDIWCELEPEKVFNMEEFHAARKDRSAYLKMLKRIIEDRGLNTEPLIKLIRDFVDEDKIRSRKVIFGMVTVSVRDMKPIEIYLDEIPHGQLSEYIIASANFPLFKAARIDGRWYSDGGLYNNYPINMLVSKGVRDIVSVRTFGIGIVRSADLKDSDITYIEPREKLGPILDFSAERIRHNIKLGYYDANKVINKYVGNRYYIENDYPPDFIESRLSSLSRECLEPLAQQMGCGDEDPKRFLFETLIPKAAEYAKLEPGAGYDEIVLSIFELLAEDSGMERFKIYKFSDFSKQILEGYKQAEAGSLIETLPMFITKNDLIPKSVKLKILKEIAVRIIHDY